MIQTGIDISFEHLDGHVVKKRKEGVTSPGDVIKLPNEGMPRRGSDGKAFGNLYIRFSVVFPKVRMCLHVGRKSQQVDISPPLQASPQCLS